MEWFKNNYLNKNTKLKILDVGSLDKTGNYNYSTIFDEDNWSYIGCDIENGNNVDIIIDDIYNWSKIEDDSYDVIISGQFFEHIKFFWFTLGQIKRVLKPGGYVCIIAPSDGPTHGGDLPDCYRFYEDSARAMAKYINFDVIHASTNNSDEAKPWYDTCLVAYKNVDGEVNTHKLENMMNNLENKLDNILNVIKSK